MATIGSWGSVTFSVSPKEIKTFDGLKWDAGARFATHERHLKEPLLEFTGTEVESMTFSMYFSVYLGVNPIKEVGDLLNAMRRGEVHRLVIGPKAYGTNKWVVIKASTALQRYDNKGNLLAARVDVTMNSYSAR